MYRFYVNGKEYQEEGDGKLLPFLRNVCKLKSAFGITKKCNLLLK